MNKNFNNPLLDSDFLFKLDTQVEHDVYAKIIALTFDEDPIQEITGNVTGGSINIDGASAVRRTCSLTLVAQDVDINDFYWGLNTKFKLQIGLKNNIDDRYPDIIWFKQGTYVITSFSTSLGTSNYTINIQGKDKMCLLNGDVGGGIESVSADFGKYDVVDENGNIETKDFLIKDIILEAVHHYGKEPFHNIIIEDLDTCGLELMEYRGDAPLFLFFNQTTGEVGNMKFDDDADDEEYFLYQLADSDEVISLRNPPDSFIFDNRITELDLSEIKANNATKIKGSQDDGNESIFTVAKVTYGDTCGYRLTDLTYPGDLILSTGDSLTSVLDKLVQMLGEFEYFYNLDGQFVFRKKATYLNTSWNTIQSSPEDGITYVDNAAYNSSSIYSFTDSNLVSSFSNNPNLLNLKNDFSIWGKRNGESNVQFHLRYAIDAKPKYYKSYNGKVYITSEEYENVNNLSNYLICDWREIIYQMAIDYYKYGHSDDFIPTIASNNSTYYPNGYTKYEQYYADMQGFWREIYNPELESIEINESNVEDIAPSSDIGSYYVWDSMNQKFNKYSLAQCTDIKDIPQDIDLYYKYGTISLEDIENLITEKKAAIGNCGGKKSLVRKINPNNTCVYYCYQNIEDNITEYHWLRDDLYQVYKKYYKFKDGENYYNYGLALDLTDLSQSKPYFYSRINENNELEWVRGEKIYLNEKYDYIGTVSEDTFKNRGYNFFKKINDDEYEVVNEWSVSTEYYKLLQPTNFNIFNTDYYEYIGYIETSSIVPGSTYYSKDKTKPYLRCENVKSEKSKMVKAPTVSKDDFITGKYYTEIKSPIYTQSLGDFEGDEQYYLKESDNYSPITLKDPDEQYYVKEKKNFYISQKHKPYQIDTPYYYKVYKKTSLSDQSYEQSYYYLKDKYTYIKFSAINKNSLQTYYVKKDAYIKVIIDAESDFYTSSEQYYEITDIPIKATEYIEGELYYIRTPEYKEANPTPDTYKAGEYYILNSTTGEMQIDNSSTFSYDKRYKTMEYKYTQVPGLTQTKFNEGGTSGYKNITYYIYNEQTGKYSLAPETYLQTQKYYTREDHFTHVSDLTASSYVKGKYYVLNGDEENTYTLYGGEYLPGYTYWIKTSEYTEIAVKQREFETKRKTTVTSKIDYYIKQQYIEAADTFKPSSAYYVKSYEFSEIKGVPTDSSQKYYKCSYILCEDEEFDKNKEYYFLYHPQASITSEEKYIDTELYIKEEREVFESAKNTLDSSKIYYEPISDSNNKYREVTIYYPKKYYTKSKEEEAIYLPEYEFNSANATKYYTMSDLSFTIINSDGKEISEQGYFGDGIHEFYLQSEEKYIKQTEYSAAKTNQYYIQDFYQKEFSIIEGQNYYDDNGAIVQNFVRGKRYYSDPTHQIEAFYFDKSKQYYTYIGYSKVKTTNGLEYGMGYLEYNTTNIMYKNYIMYPTNIYYGYTVADWNEKKSEDDLYVYNNNTKTYELRKILHHFERGKKYYYHNWGMDKIDSSKIRIELKNSFYYLDKNGQYINCFNKAKSIASKNNNLSLETLSEIYSTTGWLFSNTGNLNTATFERIDSSKQYYINQCDFREYNYLVYNFSPLPKTVYLSDKINPETYWTMDIDTPENLLFWFDFLDTNQGSELAKYGANSIGNRPKAINDEAVKAIYYRDTPNVIFIDPLTEVDKTKSGYAYLNLTDNIENLFAISGQGKTAFDQLNSFLYDFSYCVESISISIIPVYYLEPNTRILVSDSKSGINGEYLISKITIPLNYNGMMTVNATKAVDRIY